MGWGIRRLMVRLLRGLMLVCVGGREREQAGARKPKRLECTFSSFISLSQQVEGKGRGGVGSMRVIRG